MFMLYLTSLHNFVASSLKIVFANVYHEQRIASIEINTHRCLRHAEINEKTTLLVDSYYCDDDNNSLKWIFDICKTGFIRDDVITNLFINDTKIREDDLTNFIILQIFNDGNGQLWFNERNCCWQEVSESCISCLEKSNYLEETTYNILKCIHCIYSSSIF